MYNGAEVNGATNYENCAMFKAIITFPSTLQSIGSAAFSTNHYNTNAYETYIGGVIMLSTTPPTISEDTFGGGFYYEGSHGENITITVPKGCVDIYKAAEVWPEYRIVEAS